MFQCLMQARTMCQIVFNDYNEWNSGKKKR